LTNNIKVIPSSQPMDWTFFDWVAMDGSNPIQEWLEEESFEVQILFNSVLKMAKKQQRHLNWSCYRHKMKGKEGIHELGFTADGKPYRLLVKFDGINRMVILCGCYHKMQKWTPTEAPKTAANRAKALSLGRAQLLERKIQDDF
jgi:hypothetical protein